MSPLQEQYMLLTAEHSLRLLAPSLPFKENSNFCEGMPSLFYRICLFVVRGAYVYECMSARVCTWSLEGSLQKLVFSLYHENPGWGAGLDSVSQA